MMWVSRLSFDNSCSSFRPDLNTTDVSPPERPDPNGFYMHELVGVPFRNPHFRKNKSIGIQYEFQERKILTCCSNLNECTCTA
uniref:Uncharacterized protein n=1 Tax=Glossina palpalis gambiensis TaxID=67801 RepID=A0A1B0AKH0_9MUSC